MGTGSNEGGGPRARRPRGNHFGPVIRTPYSSLSAWPEHEPPGLTSLVKSRDRHQAGPVQRTEPRFGSKAPCQGGLSAQLQEDCVSRPCGVSRDPSAPLSEPGADADFRAGPRSGRAASASWRRLAARRRTSGSWGSLLRGPWDAFRRPGSRARSSSKYTVPSEGALQSSHAHTSIGVGRHRHVHLEPRPRHGVPIRRGGAHVLIAASVVQ